MNTLIVGSTDRGAGKTSVVVGLAGALGRSLGYMKPLGDRLLYRKKRLWDYDSALMTNIFGLKENLEDMTLGFEHSKLRYMYDEAGTRSRLLEMARNTGKGKELLFVECGQDLKYGSSVYLDAISVARYLAGRLLLIASGDTGKLEDDVAFVLKRVNMADIDFAGVIVNQVRSLEDFEDTGLADMRAMGVDVLGAIPYEAELSYLTIGHLADRLLAKVVAGERGLDRRVKNVLVGAMSTNVAIRSPLFKKEGKLLITGGDRSDMILASLESDTAGIILTNNILPRASIISKASEREIPLLLVPFDTYETAMRVDKMEPLLAQGDAEKIELWGRLVRKYVALDAVVGS
jgi:BioD-like phosphotransacetylase family protein